MSEERPNQTASGASVLIVGLTPAVLARVATRVAPLGIEARMTTLATLRTDTEYFNPLVVLVDAYLYDFDPHAFDKLARDVGAKLGVVSNDKEAEELVEKMLRAPMPTDSSATDKPTPAPARREFDTAKYDTKTIKDALERMGTKRPELTTAKYDAKTLHEALERMNATRPEQETAKYDAQALREAIKRLDDS